MNKNRMIMTVVVMLLTLTFTGTGYALDCGEELTLEDGVYTLDCNLDCEGTAIIIAANGITLDFDGYTITGNATGSGVEFGTGTI